jgi:hypothetical protein
MVIQREQFHQQALRLLDLIIQALLDFTGCKSNVYHALPVATQKRSGEPR